ncbi:MAG: GNAT family N-acetyltransferase [Chloroflexota bacterium]|nr:GNAT family N-acetyltransferase [Chloroflexota bacterium]
MRLNKISQLAIRFAVEGDLKGAALIWNERASLLQQSDGLQPLTPERILDWQRQARSWLTNDDCGFFVGEANKRISGYMAIMIREGPAGLGPAVVGEVIDMAVDLHESHPGLSSALLDEARKWLKARDIAYLTVDVPAHYPVEEAFWRAQGARTRFHQNWLALS